MNFFKVPIQVIFSKKHRLAAKKGITVEELAGEKVLWPDSQWKIPGVVMLGVCLCLTGTFLGGMIPTLMGIPVQLPKIGAVYAGTAGGIIATIQIVGAVMLPSYVLVPAAGGQLEMLFLLAGGCMLLAGAMVLFVKEIR